MAVPIVQKAGASGDRLKRRVEQELERLPGVSGTSGGSEQVYVTGRLNRLLTQAEDEAKWIKDEYVLVEYQLLAMTDDGEASSWPGCINGWPSSTFACS